MADSSLGNVADRQTALSMPPWLGFCHGSSRVRGCRFLVSAIRICNCKCHRLACTGVHWPAWLGRGYGLAAPAAINAGHNWLLLVICFLAHAVFSASLHHNSLFAGYF